MIAHTCPPALLVIAAATLSACAPMSAGTVPVVETPVAIAAAPLTAAETQGGAYAEQRCAGCHAIGMTDASPRAAAPPLRDFFKRYPRDGLRAAFMNGVHVGAPDMPAFRLSAQEADRLVAYLRSVDPCLQDSKDAAAMDRCFAPL